MNIYLQTRLLRHWKIDGDTTERGCFVTSASVPSQLRLLAMTRGAGGVEGSSLVPFNRRSFSGGGRPSSINQSLLDSEPYDLGGTFKTQFLQDTFAVGADGF